MRNWVLTVVVAALAIFIAVTYWKVNRIESKVESTTTHGEESRVSIFSRVLQSGELRVGYFVVPPYMNKDSATGKLSGTFYDLTEKLGENLSLKVLWVEEVSLTNLSAGFETNRYDMIAFPLWRSAARAKNVSFSVPLFYSAIGIYVRTNDTRFDKNISLLNSPNITVAAIDGELAAAIAKSDFPRAKIASMPQLVDYSQLLLEVASNKADVTFFNRLFGNRFIVSNPGRVRDISGNQPIRVFAECFILPIGETEFASMIDSALLELIENGGLDKALRENGENPAEYYRRAVPYSYVTK